MQPTVLFNESSIAGISLVNFSIDKQVTVAAIGIPVGASVTFEMVRLNSPSYEKICPGSCEMPPVQFASEIAWQPLMCCNGNNVSISAANPYALLDSPQHVRMRALLTGYDFNDGPFPGEIIVYPSDSTIPHDALRGCCVSDVAPTPACVQTLVLPNGTYECGIIEAGVIVYDAQRTVVTNTCLDTIISDTLQYREAGTTGAWSAVAPC